MKQSQPATLDEAWGRAVPSTAVHWENVQFEYSAALVEQNERGGPPDHFIVGPARPASQMTTARRNKMPVAQREMSGAELKLSGMVGLYAVDLSL